VGSPRPFPWVSAALVALAALLVALPGSGEALEYDRARVAAGEVWRLATAQAVHWTPRMALADLGAILVLGAWLERSGQRKRMLVATFLGAALALAGVALLLPRLALYRGSSASASALFVLAALEIVRHPPRRGARALALAALLLFAAKVAWEALTGQPLFAAPLPPGVAVVPLAHLLGGAAGGLMAISHQNRPVEPQLGR
jgi:rhomboid family GlyGly-CTERM serine protease